jgi:hypothetical protein
VRDVVIRAKLHVNNNHSGLLPEQVEELDRVRRITCGVLESCAGALQATRQPDVKELAGQNRALRLLAHELDRNQAVRIVDNVSKTRLSILFYSLMWDCLKIVEQTTCLMSTFESPMNLVRGRIPACGATPADLGSSAGAERLETTPAGRD